MATPANPNVATLPVRVGGAAFEAWLERLRYLARRRALAITSVIAFSIVLRLVAGLVIPHPRPYVGDEFSYLLGGELLASGKLAASEHPMWRFFESPHILVHPVYASKYPPAQAVFIAIGEKLFGDPATGVILSVALFAGAVCWALQAYVPAAWAVLGGLFTSVVFGPGHYWSESYWGGAVIGLGAALMIGAYRRITFLRAPAYGWLGIGALILLNSRPFEGGVLVACCGGLVLFDALRRGNLDAVATLAVTASLIIAVIAFYNWNVTSSPWQMPYSAYQAQYGPAPTLWILPARLAPAYGHPELQRLFERLIHERDNVLAWSLPRRSFVLLVRLVFVMIFGVGPLAFLPVIFVPAIWRANNAVRALACIAIALTAFLLLDVSMFLHYAAPLITVLLVLSFVALHRMTRPRNGRAVAFVIAALMFGSAFLRVGEAMAGTNINYPARPPFRFDREAVIQKLSRIPGR